MQEYVVASMTLMLLAFVQNISFSIVSRSRNRNNLKYHLIAAFFSNATWYLTFRSLVTAGMTLDLFWWYCAGTMLGSATGVRISVYIERLLHIGSDDHLRPKVDVAALAREVEEMKSYLKGVIDIEELHKKVARLEERFPDRLFAEEKEEPMRGGRFA